MSSTSWTHTKRKAPLWNGGPLSFKIAQDLSEYLAEEIDEMRHAHIQSYKSSSEENIDPEITTAEGKKEILGSIEMSHPALDIKIETEDLSLGQIIYQSAGETGKKANTDSIGIQDKNDAKAYLTNSTTVVKKDDEDNLLEKDKSEVYGENHTILFSSDHFIPDSKGQADTQESIQPEEAQHPFVLVTQSKFLKMADLRYSVDLIPVKGEDEIPYYGLFSTLDIPAHSYICSVFGTLTDISDHSTSFLPSEKSNGTYTLPPFNLKVLKNKGWILDSRTRGDAAGRFVRRSCTLSEANSDLFCLIVDDQPLISEKIVFGIFSSKHIPGGTEIVLNTPDCVAFPCSCDNGTICKSKDKFSFIAQKMENRTNSHLKDVKAQKSVPKKVTIKKNLPSFLRILVLSHKKNIKKLKGTYYSDKLSSR